MRRPTAAIISLLIIVIAAASSFARAADDPATLERGRELSRLFVDSKIDTVWARMTPAMQAALKSKDGLADFRAQVGAQLGDEVEVLEEKTSSAEGVAVYLRTARWSKLPRRIQMQWAVDSEGRVAGFYVRPDPNDQTPAPTTRLDYETKAKLRLPFDGEWFVFWGGRTIEQNYHVINRGQRFAYDFLVMRDGKSRRGDGAQPADYFCWDTPILAPADGTVATMVDGLPDQKIGARDPTHAAGNHVVLDLGHGEFALLAHLREGSIAVKPGDAVKAGQPIGRCGNSGNTTEPHLHFHLQDAARFGEGEGLPAFFVDYLADGKTVAHGEPLRGQLVKMP
jgi:hypothetical protein